MTDHTTGRPAGGGACASGAHVDQPPRHEAPPRPGNICDAIVTAAYRTAYLGAPAALALLLLAAVLVAGGAA